MLRAISSGVITAKFCTAVPAVNTIEQTATRTLSRGVHRVGASGRDVVLIPMSPTPRIYR
ncbi:hypothetical protein GCM10009754_27870 [Amycolatopsis minnesotensis]|uniref:Uncharacterized protein n=1 Tax=Amycolatopsis minnesotensis TaxID=337894 RepID=A0ABN2QQ37_9PSEU